MTSAPNSGNAASTPSKQADQQKPGAANSASSTNANPADKNQQQAQQGNQAGNSQMGSQPGKSPEHANDKPAEKSTGTNNR